MRAVVLIALLASCTLEKMPPIVMVRNGVPAQIHRIVVLPSECGTALCKGLDAVVAAELSFRGYEIVDLDRLAAIERKRTEVIVSSVSETNGQQSTASSRTVTVQGPMLSDVDIWTLRAELKAMGIDSVVRVRTADVFGRPQRVAALVRVTRVDDAALIASVLCEIEVNTFHTYQEASERSTRCALQQVLK
jgi:hypothetical protein